MWPRALQVDDSHLVSLERQFLEREALSPRTEVSLTFFSGKNYD